MNRQRILLLVVLTTLFVAAGFWRIYSEIQISRTHFLTGSPPKNILTSFLTKEVDPSTVRSPAILATDQIRFGSTTSVLSFIQFGDYQCEACRDFSLTAQNVVASYGGDVRYVWKDLPLKEIHDKSVDAAIFARCAGQQDKFWETHDKLIERGNLSETALTTIARENRLDLNLLSACRINPDIRTTLEQDVDFAKSEGINAVPFFFIGTKGFVGALTEQELRTEIENFAKR